MEYLKKFDTKEVNSFVFHPRKDISPNLEVQRLSIEVEEDINIGASFFEAGKTSPFILYFHGNGEIVSDYDDLGYLFIQKGINFMPVDYRGYGLSNGEPSLVKMLEDASIIADFGNNFRKENKFTGRFAIMGRSLGSASAIELASSKNYFDNLIIESGFSDFISLIKILGFYDKSFEGLKDPFDHINKIKKFINPLLIIHGEFDEIIPFNNGEDLFEASQSKIKKLIKIEDAGHNTIFSRGLELYFDSIVSILNR